MSHNCHEHYSSDKQSLFSELQSFITATLQQSLAERDKASMAVSGGSTPAPLYESLTDAPLDWSKVDITLTDERYVPADDADSNEAMLRRSLLKGAAAKSNFIPLMRTSESAEATAALSSAALEQMHLPMDLVILGMGNDMHTASLFPGAPELNAAMSPDQKALCMAVQPSSSPYPRLSMTLNTLLNCRAIVLLITGDEKRATLDRALKSESINEAPIAALLQQDSIPVHIFWSP